MVDGARGTEHARGGRMSEQALDLRRSMQIVWRHKYIVGTAAALGLSAGIAYATLHPPMLTSRAVVVLPAYIHDTATQVVIANSTPVLDDARQSMGSGMSLTTLNRLVQAKSLTYNAISISAQGRTATQAEDTANAVAESYVGFLAKGRPSGGKPVPAKVLNRAAGATGTPLSERLLITGGLGALIGLLLGAIAALAIGRRDRRLRERDEIADSIGVPVLASIPVVHPSDAAGWTKLLEDYKPGAVDAWRLRKALQHLGLADVRGNSGASLAILSLSSDPGALALGPQLAVFAASLGIPTALVMGPQQDENAAATLRAACAGAQARWLGHLRVSVPDHDSPDPQHDAALTAVVSVVDPQAPQVAGTMRTTATVLGVSAGAATAEQLARVAASAASSGHQIAGILVADPASTDHTTGRLPELARPAHRRMPTRLTDVTRETRR